MGGIGAQFGAIDIDSELVALRERGPNEDEPELLMTLDNGCACCTVNENFVEILFQLVRSGLACRRCHLGFQNEVTHTMGVIVADS